jgi:hypothetical protein
MTMNSMSPNELKRSLKDWMLTTMRLRDWTAERWGSEAGVAATTITRFLNNTTYKHTLSARTIAKLADAANVPMDFSRSAGKQAYIAVLSKKSIMGRLAMGDGDFTTIYSMTSNINIPVPAKLADCKALELSDGKLALCRNASPKLGQRVVACCNAEGDLMLYRYHPPLLISLTRPGEALRIKDADTKVIGVCVGIIELFEEFGVVLSD